MKIFVVKGGFSKEREISLRTGLNIEKSIVNLGYELISFDLNKHNILEMMSLIEREKPDLIINALHGTFGEDGTIQGLFEALEVPYTHSGVLASALAMNKVKSKLIFEHFGLPIPKFEQVTLETVKNHTIKMPFVMKPVSEGSSLGVCVIKSDEDLKKAVESWEFEDDILLEEYIEGREMTVAVMDDEVLGVCEIRMIDRQFIDYDSKYVKGVAEKLFPAPITKEEERKIGALAKKAHDVLGCKGLTRIDFILRDETFYVLELNSQPGCTQTSFVPLIAEQKGWSMDDLVSKLIQSTLKASIKQTVSLA